MHFVSHFLCGKSQTSSPRSVLPPIPGCEDTFEVISKRPAVAGETWSREGTPCCATRGWPERCRAVNKNTGWLRRGRLIIHHPSILLGKNHMHQNVASRAHSQIRISKTKISRFWNPVSFLHFFWFSREEKFQKFRMEAAPDLVIQTSAMSWISRYPCWEASLCYESWRLLACRAD